MAIYNRHTQALISDAEPMPKAYLRGADLTEADLHGADLTRAYLTGATLPAGTPAVPNIHATVYAAASAPGALNMRTWHTCDTTHCRAGWIVVLAGDAGRELERDIGTNAAAALIYYASDPTLDRVPDWCANAVYALADMARLAGLSNHQSGGDHAN